MFNQAKRRHAAVMHVGSWKDEGYCENILEQKVAKLLGQAMENNRQVLATMLIDQEAFAINVCGTKLKIPVTYFTGDYLVAVNIKVMPTDHILRVRWDLELYRLSCKSVSSLFFFFFCVLTV